MPARMGVTPSPGLEGDYCSVQRDESDFWPQDLQEPHLKRCIEKAQIACCIE